MENSLKGDYKKRVAILQSNYIPWKGYFDIINSVDLFIFYDDLQYTIRDWRNRNLIKGENGVKWLTVPCGSSTSRLICEVELHDSSWQKKHWNKIEAYYRKSNYFNYYKSFFEDIYLGKRWKNLSDMNQYIIKSISKEIFGIETVFDDSRKYNLKKKKSLRVLELLKKVDAELYLSGPSAKKYLKEDLLTNEGIALEWMNYEGYPVYKQLYPPFEHNVSIIDLIFNEGVEATKYMKSFIEKV